MKIGIVGLPNVGKSTLFNALTKTYAADAANFPFCTIEPNVWIVNVVDPRVDNLAKISHSEKIVYASVKFVDIAGLVKGASAGQWLGNKFLAHIREVDAILQVVRHFEDTDVVHVEGRPEPLRDVDIINTELMLADLEHVESKIPHLEKRAKTGWDKETKALYEGLVIVQEALRQGKLAIDVVDSLTPDQLKQIQMCQFLTFKPFIYALNVSQEQLLNADTLKQQYQEILKKPVWIVCAKFEAEMMEFSEAEKKEFLAVNADHHIPTLDDTIRLAFDTLGLMYYFTTGEKETRARTLKKASTAPEAAGVIHTDFQRWFIKAEVVSYSNFVADGGRSAAKEKGHVKLEWKEYIVQDWDIMLFKFNV